MSGGLTVTGLLALAAERADAAPTTRLAVHRAWGMLHTSSVDDMAEAFRRWCAAEDFGGHASGLGEVLRRRYSTPAEIAESLRRAATITAITPGGRPSAAMPCQPVECPPVDEIVTGEIKERP